MNTKILAMVGLSAICGLAVEFACDGCARDNYTWGGGAVNEVWTYTPGLGDDDGHCRPNCTYDKQCRYTGTLKFQNNFFPAGGGPRSLEDSEGGAQGGGPIPLGKSFTMTIDLKSPCGAVGGAGPSYVAKDANGVVTSEYKFYCTACSES